MKRAFRILAHHDSCGCWPCAILNVWLGLIALGTILAAMFMAGAQQ
jgi:hypothetical protein